MSLIILVAGIINTLLIITFIRQNYFGILFVTSWWFFWLFVSALSISENFIPEETTYLFFMVMISSITLGGLVYKLTKKSYHKIPEYKPSPDDLIKTNNRFFVLITVISFPYIVFLIFNFYQNIIIQNIAFDASYRTFSVREVQFIENERLALIYSLLGAPLPYVSLFCSGAILYFYKEYKLFLASAIIIIIDSIVTLGRFGIYSCLLVLLVSILYGKSFELKEIYINLFKRLKRKSNSVSTIFLAAFSILLILFFISYIRFASLGISFYEAVVQKTIVDYHTLGFTIFDLELRKGEILENKTYGLSSIGNLERVYYLIYSRFNKNIESIAVQNILELDDFSLVGPRKISNAFGTNLFLLYRDGGLIFVSFYSIVYGFILSKLEYNNYRLGIKNMSFFLIFFHEGIMGIFLPSYNFALFIVMAHFLIPGPRKKVKYKTLVVRKSPESTDIL